MKASEARELSKNSDLKSYYESEQFVKDNQEIFDLIKKRANLRYTHCSITTSTSAIEDGLIHLGYKIVNRINNYCIISWE